MFALVADKNFQAVQTLDEAKLLLNDQPIGTFLLHFVRAVPGINEAGYCATWVEDKYAIAPVCRASCVVRCALCALCRVILRSVIGRLVSPRSILAARTSPARRVSGAWATSSSPTSTSCAPGSSGTKSCSSNPIAYLAFPLRASTCLTFLTGYGTFFLHSLRVIWSR